MKVLIVEDDDERIKNFKIHLCKHKLIFAKTAPASIESLRSGHFDYVFLDHDLDEENTGKDGEGIDVVRHVIKEAACYQKTTFILHSMNPVGAKNMKQELERAGLKVECLPYSWLVWNEWKLNL